MPFERSNHEQERQDMAGAPEDDGGGSESPSLGRVIRLLEARLRQDATEHEQRRRADRKKEQRDGLTFAVLFAYTIVTALILVVQLDANRIATRNFDAQNRAWVHLAGVEIAFDRKSTPDAPAFMVDATLENVGGAPAYGVGLLLEVVAGSGPLPVQADLCGPFRQQDKSRNVIFPHSPFLDQNRTLHVLVRKPGVPEFGVAHLIGCIDYATRPGGEHRQTQVIRTIVGKDHTVPATFPAFMAAGAGLTAENDLPEQAD